MRKPVLSAALLWLSLAASNGADAATLTIDASSAFEIRVGVLPPISVGAVGATPVLVSSGGGSFVEPASIFATTNALPSALFTGVPLIAGLDLTAVHGTGTFAASAGLGGGFGGSQPLQGQILLDVLSGIVDPAFPLSVMGVAGGAVTAVGAFDLRITVTGTGWTTGVAAITGITFTTLGGGVVSTATLAGTDQRTAGHRGTLMLVTPMRVLTNAAGNIPVFGIQTLSFVPEPAPLVLLAAVAAGLAAVGGRKRDR